MTEELKIKSSKLIAELIVKFDIDKLNEILRLEEQIARIDTLEEVWRVLRQISLSDVTSYTSQEKLHYVHKGEITMLKKIRTKINQLGEEKKDGME